MLREPDHRDLGVVAVGEVLGRLFEHLLRAVGLIALEIMVRQKIPVAQLLRILLDERLVGIDGVFGPVLTLEDIDLHQLERHVVLVLGEAVLDGRQGHVRIAPGLIDPRRQQDRIDMAGIDFERRVRLLERLVEILQPVHHGAAQRMGGGIVRRGLEQRVAGLHRVVELVRAELQPAEIAEGFRVVGIELNDPVEVAERVVPFLVVKIDLGQVKPGIGQLVVDLERIAELEAGLDIIALREKFLAVLHIGRRLLLGRAAAHHDESDHADGEREHPPRCAG